MNKIPTINFRDNSIETIMAGVNMEQVKSVVFGKFLPNIKVAVEKNKKEYSNQFKHVSVNRRRQTDRR